MRSVKQNNKELGDAFERECSEYYHNDYLPLLISTKVMRSYRMSQIDLAFFSKEKRREGINCSWNINILEIKNYPLLTFTQKSRLRKSSNFISKIFNLSVRLDYLFKKLDYS